MTQDKRRIEQPGIRNNPNENFMLALSRDNRGQELKIDELLQRFSTYGNEDPWRSKLLTSLIPNDVYQGGAFFPFTWQINYMSLQGSTVPSPQLSNVSEEFILWLPAKDVECYVFMKCTTSTAIVNLFNLPPRLQVPTQPAPTIEFVMQSNSSIILMTSGSSVSPASAVGHSRELVSAFIDVRADNTLSNALTAICGKIEGAVSTCFYGNSEQIHGNIFSSSIIKDHCFETVTARISAILYPDNATASSYIQTINLNPYIKNTIQSGTGVLLLNFGIPTISLNVTNVPCLTPFQTVYLNENDVVPYYAMPIIRGDYGVFVFHVYLTWTTNTIEIVIRENTQCFENAATTQINQTWIGCVVIPQQKNVLQQCPIPNISLSFIAYNNIRVVSFTGLAGQPIVVNGMGFAGVQQNNRSVGVFAKFQLVPLQPELDTQLRININNETSPFRRMWLMRINE